MLKRIAILIGIVLSIVIILQLPHIVWLMRPRHGAAIVIVDKTVPFPKYREHSFLPWFFRSLKIADPQGRFINEAYDYIGYDPINRTGYDVLARDLADADALFITDTYGVYEGDYQSPEQVAALERSPRIYGGMSELEADAVELFSRAGKLVIGEFNTFASPTADAPRAMLEMTFGVRWTRWVARYWPDMQDEREVPKWVGRTYQRVYGQPLTVRGAAFVFVRDDQDIVVLKAGEHLQAEPITIERTGDATDLAGLPQSSSYRYWLDIVTPARADVVYEHVLHLTEDGERVAKAHDIPLRFPALSRRKGRQTYYFAGDFVDASADRGDPERAGLLTWRRWTVSLGPFAQEQYLWAWYAPIVESLLTPRLRSRE